MFDLRKIITVRSEKNLSAHNILLINMGISITVLKKGKKSSKSKIIIYRQNKKKKLHSHHCIIRITMLKLNGPYTNVSFKRYKTKTHWIWCHKTHSLIKLKCFYQLNYILWLLKCQKYNSEIGECEYEGSYKWYSQLNCSNISKTLRN